MPVDRGLIRGVAAAIAAVSTGGATAQVTIAPILGDHSVIQRDRSIHVHGTAAPGEAVRVTLAQAVRSTRADRQGRWSVDLPAMSAGGPYRLVARAAGGSLASAGDVMIGDVWLCSGQSNMEYPLRRALNGEAEVAAAHDPQLRIVKIAQNATININGGFAKTPQWQPVTPDSAKDFSAACYFMARDLRATQKVPIGAIDATWGGTPIRAWMGEAAVRATGGAGAAELVELYRRDPFAATRAFGESWGSWWRSQTGDRTGQEPWLDSARLKWTPLPGFAYWDSWSPSFTEFDGAIWARKGIRLSSAEAANPATLSLGVVDDMDLTFVNGVAVGSTNDWSAPRHYKIAPGVLNAGNNEVLVYVRDNWGPGGFQGPAEMVKLTFADGRETPLGHGWEYARIADRIGAPPAAPWDGPSGVGTIRNGMIAPLGPIGLKGVAWYQGEADVGLPRYDARLAAMMTDWRRQFRDPRLPFLIVALAGFGKPSAEPVASGWAALIDEQRRAAAADRAAALVVATDLGERNDIHPANKNDVGRRLALAARSLAYADNDVALGPLPTSLKPTARGYVVSFTRPLQALSGPGPLGFELCADTQASCRYSDARIEGNTVLLSNDGQPATRVRYAWSDYAILNLYSGELPAPPFELPVDASSIGR